MLKIVHIVPTYYPYQSGGSAYSLYRLNCGLKNINKVVISEGIKKKKKNDHITHDLNHKVFFHNRFSFFFINRIVKESKKADAIQLSSFFFPPNIFAFIVAKVFRKKIIISPRGEFFEYALSRKKKQKEFFIKIFNLINISSVFHATSEEEIELIREKITSKKKSIIKIFNSFDTEFNETETRLNQFLFLGRINPIKNIHSVFNVLKNTNDITFLIAGEANLPYEKEYLIFLKSEIKRLHLQQKVIFTGKIHNEEKYKLIARSRFLILPSHSENFGNVVLESLSQGTPVIASKGSPWSILENTKCGFHIDFNKEVEIKNSINSLMNLSENDLIQVKKSCRKILENFSTHTINKQWEKLYYSKLL
ncbi:glycosyltransferase family 4 protein [Aurantibacter sp.]|uniref:glycosyltransferase family 4 protein n=1 Tax=Aurantibacter sp. TaxID=2807103 RepID=UPI0035C7FA02